ncbi:MAG: plastocyanin domain-containing protein [Glaciecola sp.]|jgi:plastocyanin domain-containing protein
MLWINLAGVALIVLIVWWFWIYKLSSITLQEGVIEVIVKDGVYQPSNIKIRANEATTITFNRVDPSPCSETLLIPDLEINATLTLNKKVSVEIPASLPGRYPFHCQMKMYVGELVVE